MDVDPLLRLVWSAALAGPIGAGTYGQSLVGSARRADLAARELARDAVPRGEKQALRPTPEVLGALGRSVIRCVVPTGELATLRLGSPPYEPGMRCCDRLLVDHKSVLLLGVAHLASPENVPECRATANATLRALPGPLPCAGADTLAPRPVPDTCVMQEFNARRASFRNVDGAAAAVCGLAMGVPGLYSLAPFRRAPLGWSPQCAWKRSRLAAIPPTKSM
jgi:hypothetical protein